MDEAGITLQVSYTRVDEKGSCYAGAGWTPVAYVVGRDHVTGNRALRWLPGLFEPSTEKIDRVRWERGPRSPSKEPDVELTRVGESWLWIRKMKEAA